MNDVQRIFQAFVGPAIFVSATSLLLLSLNVRLMGMVSRLRQYCHNKYTAAKQGRHAEADAYASQIAAIESRAELIRKAFLLTLVCLAGTIASCLLLGLGLYWQFAEVLAIFIFVASILSLLVGAIYYLREVSVALSSVRDEAADSRFMDIGVGGSSSEERRTPRGQ
jgi:hypothetical protein